MGFTLFLVVFNVFLMYGKCIRGEVVGIVGGF